MNNKHYTCGLHDKAKERGFRVSYLTKNRFPGVKQQTIVLTTCHQNLRREVKPRGVDDW